MRSEQEMFDLILNIAHEDERIRAVIMNGSRANPDAPRDFFQDYDIVYVVTDHRPFRHAFEWIRRFGEMMILQLPDDMSDPPPSEDAGFAYLMQFMDGNRIDLTIFPIAKLDELGDDSLTVVLLDKDGIIRPFPPASEKSYLPEPPAAKKYYDCCNEFWWVSPYVAKGLWRGEIIYAKSMLDEYVREQLMKMLRWYIGMKTGFAIDPGKLGKYYAKYLEPESWELLLRTYSDASYGHNWDALEAMCDLFRNIAIQVAEHFGFEYPYADDERVSAHLKHVRQLPRDAKVMY